MKLIVDTNRIIAALIKDSISRKILLFDKLEFATINIAKEEIEKYKQYIKEKSHLTDEQLENLLFSLFNKIQIIDDNIIQNNMEKAKQIMDEIDTNDAPFIAAALCIENNGIWSDDRHFEQQDKIKVWKTKDLLEHLKAIEEK